MLQAEAVEESPRAAPKGTAVSDQIAQRTLVKSPPELWAEVSDVASLARHLGEFGEIAITRVEPETTVVWEGERASGTVELEPSGWGTKVTLTAALAAVVDAEPVEPEPEAAVAAEGPEAEAVIEQEPTAETQVEAEPEPEAVAEAVVDEQPLPEPSVMAVAPIPAPLTADEMLARSGFFSRVFGRRRRTRAEIGGPSAPTPLPTPPTPAPDPSPTPEPTPEPPAPTPLPSRPPAPEPPAAAEAEPVVVAAEPEPEPDPLVPEAEPVAPVPAIDVEAVLSGVLDTLGAAHHRPFSR